jgi:hypothetical protein
MALNPTGSWFSPTVQYEGYGRAEFSQPRRRMEGPAKIAFSDSASTAVYKARGPSLTPVKEWRGRLEKLIETLNEATDVPAHMPDGAERDLHGDVAKRWLDGKSALHAHLWVRSRLGEAHTDKLCLLYQRKRLVRSAVFYDAGIRRVDANEFVEPDRAREEHLAHEGTVLIGVGETGEDTKFVLVGDFAQFPAVVRLRFLDKCPCLAVNGDALQGTGVFLGILGGSDTNVEVVDVCGYGEFGPSAGSVSFQEDELPNEMIQAGSDVLDNIAANQTEPRRWRQRLNGWVDTHDVPGSVKGMFEELWVGKRLEEDGKFLVQNVQVFVGPTELEPGAFERRTQKG